MRSPLPMRAMMAREVHPAMEAILSIDTSRGNRLVNERGVAITPTAKEGWVLRTSEDLLDILSWVSGRLPLVLPITTQDITPYEAGLWHVNSIMQPAIATAAPVVGMVGELPEALSPPAFRQLLKAALHVPVIKHTEFDRPIRKVALCGGAGSFLIGKARAAGADAYVTGDLKYHEYFGAEGQLLLCDVGHFESEQFTGEIFHDLLAEKFGSTFALFIAETYTNPVRYDC